MSVRPIATVGDPALREPAPELTISKLRSDDVQRLIDTRTRARRV